MSEKAKNTFAVVVTLLVVYGLGIMAIVNLVDNPIMDIMLPGAFTLAMLSFVINAFFKGVNKSTTKSNTKTRSHDHDYDILAQHGQDVIGN